MHWWYTASISKTKLVSQHICSYGRSQPLPHNNLFSHTRQNGSDRYWAIVSEASRMRYLRDWSNYCSQPVHRYGTCLKGFVIIIIILLFQLLIHNSNYTCILITFSQVIILILLKSNLPNSGSVCFSGVWINHYGWRLA